MIGYININNDYGGYMGTRERSSKPKKVISISISHKVWEVTNELPREISLSKIIDDILIGKLPELRRMTSEKEGK